MFYGANAQGKTAVLEAAYTLAIGRAFRVEREREVVNFEAARCGEAAYITGVATDGHGDMTVVIGYQPVGETLANRGASDREPYLRAVSKQIRVNRQPSTASGLVGRIGATLFVVNDLDLALGPPSGRRRYLDVLISQASRTYLDTLQRYQAALRNRNGLLRRQRDGWIDPDEIEYWDDQLVRAGSLIVIDRTKALTCLAEYAQEHHRELAEPDQTLELTYEPSSPPCQSAEETAVRFRGLLQRQAARERATAVTAVGPHRDDFRIFVGGRDAALFASRGEARTIALALRLAEADYLSALRGDDPIILLDDVFSEMDARRRARVLKKAAAYRQTLLTTTDVEAVRAVLGDSATYFRLVDNLIHREI